MLSTIATRLLLSIPVLLAVALLAFAIFSFAGDPVLIMLGQNASESARIAMTHELGLDRPLLEQYLRFVWRALHGEFGLSYRLAQPVAGLILQRAPATLELAAASMLLAMALGLPMGIYTALHRGSFGARLLMGVSLVGVSLPTFLIGVLLVLVFAVWLPWLPVFGREGVVMIGAWPTSFASWKGIGALVLPAVTLALFQMTLIARMVRAEMLEVLGRDFIRFARARGLTARSINLGHALRNTLVPVITIAGLQFGFVIAFALVTESVFQWPGLGLLLVQSIAVGDIPVMTAYLLMVALVFVAINLVVDLLYLAVDPRLRARHGA